MKIFVIR